MSTLKLDEQINELLQSRNLTGETIDRLNELALRLGFVAPKRAKKIGWQIWKLAIANNYGRGGGYALRNVGWCELNVDDCHQAEKTLTRSRELFTAERDRAGIATVFNALATAKRKVGDFSGALKQYAAALDIFETLHDAAGCAAVLLNVGIVHNQGGEYALALDYYYRALPLAAEVGASEITARTQTCLSDVLWRVEESGLAIESAEQALSIFQRHPDERNLSVALVNLGAAHQHRADYNKALKFYHQGLEKARLVANYETQTEAMKCLGDVYAETGDSTGAIHYFEQSLSLARTIKHRYFESETLLKLGSAHHRLGNPAAGVELLRTAQNLSEEMNFEAINYRAHLALSEIYQAQKQPQTALAHHQAFHRIWRKLHNAASWSRIQRLLFNQGLIEDSLSNNAPNNEVKGGLLPPHKLREVVKFINHHLEHNLSVAKLAEVIGLSQNYFLILFKNTTGLTPHQFLLERRVAHAQKLLQTTELPLSEIALRCGFSSQSHFTTQFRLITGATPNQYRRSL